ncbi:NAD(+) diphosphatase [Parasulfitobacter algicola]|uniref:NAD(+) diphosphatase n=1 Tax=Parasulfitobacter algicola TaxID=2614809 RepID=A0ABX2IVI2_9RHOB|nr:NAD(+) diphosphatase [Sulfitobacter algicola]NSX54847.1 NAD(+) diphosphatase [Sulfitobacter algicola]
MKIAETVTFGGSGLDRAAELRGKSDLLADKLTHGAPVLMIWRGKPLVAGADRDRLAWVDAKHALVPDRLDQLVFLGMDDGQPRFAADVSHWEPVEMDRESLGLFLDPSEQHPPDVPANHVFAELRLIMTRLSARDAELAATAKAVLGWHHTHGFCARCGAETQMAQGGWQRDCVTCGGHHFPRTDPVVIMLITRGNKVLMGRSPGWPDRMYSLLAGFVEPGETIEAAVRREVFEEAGIRVGRVDYLASQPWAFPSSLMFGCYGEAISDEITIDPTEIEDAIWVTREDMMQVFADTHPDIAPARKGAIAHFLLHRWLADQLD